MFRKIIVATLLCGSLAACATTLTQAQLISDVQAATVAACAIEPTAASVAQLIAATNPGATAGVAIGAQIAKAICASVASRAPVASLKASKIPAPIVVHGVVVTFEPVGASK